MPNINLKSNKSRFSLMLVVLILLVAILVFTLWSKNNSSSPSAQEDQGLSQTTSIEPSAQPDFQVPGNDSSADREAGNTIREDQGSAGITDNSGNIPRSVNTQAPIKSDTGEITVYSPQKDQTVTNGSLPVAGTSSLDNIWYRISDDVSGVLTVGSLQVVNGKFSGTLEISTGAATGQVSFFGKHSNLNEYSNVTIPLKFK